MSVAIAEPQCEVKAVEHDPAQCGEVFLSELLIPLPEAVRQRLVLSRQKIKALLVVPVSEREHRLDPEGVDRSDQERLLELVQGWHRVCNEQRLKIQRFVRAVLDVHFQTVYRDEAETEHSLRSRGDMYMDGREI